MNFETYKDLTYGISMVYRLKFIHLKMGLLEQTWYCSLHVNYSYNILLRINLTHLYDGIYFLITCVNYK